MQESLALVEKDILFLEQYVNKMDGFLIYLLEFACLIMILQESDIRLERRKKYIVLDFISHSDPPSPRGVGTTVYEIRI